MAGFIVIYTVDLKIHLVVDIDWVLDFDYEKSFKNYLIIIKFISRFFRPTQTRATIKEK